MPITKKGRKIMAAMTKEYGSEKKGNYFSTPQEMQEKLKV